jgi:hypothetical protein
MQGTQISISETMHTVEHARGYTTISIERDGMNDHAMQALISSGGQVNEVNQARISDAALPYL